jgi:hypothetical protein
MKKSTFLFVAVMIVLQGFSQTSQKSKINVYQKLDRVLSPFEDMTEYALDNNRIGLARALNRVDKTQKELIFKQALSVKNYSAFEQKIKNLQQSIADNNYKKTSLISAELFKFNIDHFIYANQLKRQLIIEHLDYIGYQILALLIQDKTNWEAVSKAIDMGQVNWTSLRPEVKDSNLKDTFDQLFSGLQLSAKQKNKEMANIFASMDLSLVDVLEVSF